VKERLANGKVRDDRNRLRLLWFLLLPRFGSQSSWEEDGRENWIYGTVKRSAGHRTK
jgi:hypothetical protein